MTEAAENTPQVQESAPQAPQENSGFSVPETYQDRGWAKTIKSSEDLWSQFDNAQSMLGKRPEGIPSSDATPEEWDKFYKALGRPEEAGAYELRDEFEGVPEGVELGEYKAKAQELAHKIGLSPKQASELWDGYMEMELETARSMSESNATKEAELDKQFDEIGNGLFGDSFKDVSAQAEAYLKDVLPPELDGAVEEMRDNPKALLALIKVANHSQTEIKNTKEKYGAEDSLASGGQAAAQSQNEVVAKISDAKARWKETPVFSPQRKAIEEEIAGLRSQLK